MRKTCVQQNKSFELEILRLIVSTMETDILPLIFNDIIYDHGGATKKALTLQVIQENENYVHTKRVMRVAILFSLIQRRS